MHSPLIWIVCTSPSKLIILFLKKEFPLLCCCSPHRDAPAHVTLLHMEVEKITYEQYGASFQNQQKLSPQYSHRTSQMRKTLYLPQWLISYLITVFAYTHWSKQRSLFRKSSSYSGCPVRNKQFHFLAVATSTLSATVSDRQWFKSPTCWEVSATIQYQTCTVEQKKPNQVNWKEFLLLTS